MKSTILSIYLLLLLFFLGKISAQQKGIDVTIHLRVDTTKREVKEIAELWINYLNSKPDSIYNNPYWNKEEKSKFKNFDLSRAYLYQLPSQQLIQHFKPTILSIEKEGEYYGIRTVFSADDLQGEYRQSNPWCITKLFAVKENGEWKLKNALQIITASWNKKTVGKITFIYPKQHQFNIELAKKANSFCKQITEEFQFSEYKPFNFYITNNGDELGKLLNFDFFFAGYTTGIGLRDAQILLSGMGSEYYPHEFIHLIIPDDKRHGLIEEGFATWKGGIMNKPFEENASVLANQLASNSSVTFNEILSKEWGWQYSAYYTTGAILFQAAYNKGGIILVKQLLKTPNDHEKLIESICSLFEIEKKDLNVFWRKEVLKYKNTSSKK